MMTATLFLEDPPDEDEEHPYQEPHERLNHLHLRMLPRVGEKLWLPAAQRVDGLRSAWEITDIAHWVGDNAAGQSVAIYVKPADGEE